MIYIFHTTINIGLINFIEQSFKDGQSRIFVEESVLKRKAIKFFQQ